jgi:hypothetical protein
MEFEILAGLPTSGDWPEQFSATGMGAHREGLVVKFYPYSQSAWVGNFQRGHRTPKRHERDRGRQRTGLRC